MSYKEEENYENQIKRKNNQKKEDSLSKYEELTSEIESIIFEIADSLKSQTILDLSKMDLFLNKINSYYWFCQINKFTDIFPFPVGILLDIIEQNEYHSLIPKVLIIFNQFQPDDEFSEYFFDNRSDACLSIILSTMNDDSLTTNINLEGNLCNFILSLITDIQKFKIFSDNGLMTFFERNMPRNFAINAVNEISQYMDTDWFSSIFQIFVSHLQTCCDELAICNILKCIKKLFLQANDAAIFPITEPLIDKIKEFIHPKNQVLAAEALSIIFLMFPHSFGILHSFLTYLPDYYENDCSSGAASLLDKFYDEWREEITDIEIKKLLDLFPNMEFITAITIFPSFLKYIEITKDSDNDLIATQLCSRYIDSHSIFSLYETILPFICSIIHSYCLCNESQDQHFIDEIMKYISEIAEKIEENDELEENDKIEEFKLLYSSLIEPE